MTKTPQDILISKLHLFENHPFQVNDDEEMSLLMESIYNNGILSPLVVRPMEAKADEYEIITGHRRLREAQRLGIESVPALIYSLDRDEAAIAMVDSNFHRERLLPSEKAFAYKMKMEALKHQGKSTLDTSRQLVGKSSETAGIISDEESGRQVQRYIRLTYLIPELLQYVDDGKIALTPAVALSYFTEREQRIVLSNMEYLECTPSYSQAVKLKGLSTGGGYTDAAVLKLLSQEKANQKERIKIPVEKIQKYFPRGYIPPKQERALR